MVCFQMSYCRFNSRPPAEDIVLFSSDIVTVLCFWDIRYQYLCPVNFLLSPVAPISGQFLDFLSYNPLHLGKAFFYGMAVIFITEGFGSQYNARCGADDGNLIPKLIFLVFLTFADALDFRFVKGINLVGRITLQGKDPLVKFQ